MDAGEFKGLPTLGCNLTLRKVYVVIDYGNGRSDPVVTKIFSTRERAENYVSMNETESTCLFITEQEIDVK